MLAPNPVAGQMPMQGPQGMPAPAPMPLPPPPKWHDVTIVTKRTYACAKVEGVPPEEFGIARNARNIKDCGYCFHEVLKREDDLISQGYDADQVKALPSYVSTTTIESMRRDTVDEGRFGQSGDSGWNSANREVMITEHYVRMDYEDNGKPALYRVTTGSEQGDVLKLDGKNDIEEVDEIPFAAMTPVIITHRFFGRSIADLVMDIQRIKTALLRGMLDNLYAHNMPRAEIAEQLANENTIDDFLQLRHGGMIRVKQAGCVTWQTVPDITSAIYPALQYFDATREWRTGVSRQGQGVDPNALQNQVATIANQMADAAQAKVKLIARIFAETGIKDLFQLLHGIIRKNGQQAETVRLRNKWVNVDPRDWRERDDLTVQVGLGTGNKQQQLAAAQMIGATQEKLTGLGLVSKKNVYETAKELTKLAGHKDIDRFFTPPDKQPDPNDPASAPIPPPSDPKEAEIQAKAQAEQAKMANDAAHQKAQFERDTAHQQMKMHSDMQIQQTKTQAEIALENQKFELERELKMIDAQIKSEQHQQTMQVNAAKHAMTMQQSEAKANEKQPSAVNVSMGDVAGQIGDHLAKTQAAHTEAIIDALKESARPKRIRKNKDGSWQTETIS